MDVVVPEIELDGGSLPSGVDVSAVGSSRPPRRSASTSSTCSLPLIRQAVVSDIGGDGDEGPMIPHSSTSASALACCPQADDEACTAARSVLDPRRPAEGGGMLGDEGEAETGPDTVAVTRCRG